METALFLLIQVPKLQSGGLVRELDLLTEVREVAALYGETDVIAHVEGGLDRVGNILLEILNKPRVTTAQVFSCERVHRNPNSLRRDPNDLHQVVAFVMIHTDKEMLDRVVDGLLGMQEIRYIARIRKPDHLILAEIVASDKSYFDEIVMTKIQGTNGVMLTRSYITVTSMHEEKPTEDPEIEDVRQAALEGRIQRAQATERLGEVYACRKLGLKKMPPGTKGTDAIDDAGIRYQIKSRAPSKRPRVDLGGRLGVFHSFDFDYALLVLLNDGLRLDEIWKAKRETVRAMQEKEGSRGIHIRSFINVAQKVFPLTA